MLRFFFDNASLLTLASGAMADFDAIYEDGDGELQRPEEEDEVQSPLSLPSPAPFAPANAVRPEPVVVRGAGNVTV